MRRHPIDTAAIAVEIFAKKCGYDGIFALGFSSAWLL
jgi:hypothetical protein